MKKRSSHAKCRNSNNNNNNCKNKRKSLYELSLSLVLSLWCLVFLFYSNLILGQGNAGNRSDFSDYVNPYVSNGSYKSSKSFNNSGNSENYSSSKYSLPETNGLEVVWNVLGYSALVCEVQQRQEEQNEAARERVLSGRALHPTYLNLDEFRNITRQEKGHDAHTPAQIASIAHRLEPDGTEYNYASASKGAKVVAHNKEAKGPSNILERDHDKYLRNPCSVVEKFVVIELAGQTLVDVVKIANFEHYSSNFKEFVLSGSLSYPTEVWSPLGNFVASNVKHTQTFKLPEPKWVRYLKLNLTSHYGSEFYCTLSVIEVFGVDAIERMLEDLVAAETVTNKSPEPNSTALPSSRPDVAGSSEKRSAEAQSASQNSGFVGAEKFDDAQNQFVDTTKSSVVANKVISKIPDPVMEVRKQPNGRVPGDTILKILMQKVRSLELNLSVLEDYIKEMNRRQRDLLPGIDTELAKISSLLEKSKREMKDLLEWKEIMAKEIADLELWKTVVSTQLDLLVNENSLLRLEIKKIADVQAGLETKELAVLAISLFFVFFAILKIISVQILTFFGASQSDKLCRTSRGWVLILISSSMTVFITLIYS